MIRIVELGHGLGDVGSDPSSRLALSLPAIVIRSVGPVRHEVNVPFHDSQVKGRAVLIQTGWDERWGTEAYWEPGPSLSYEVVFRLVRSGAGAVGVDFWVTGERRTSLVAGGEIPIVENLRDLAVLPRWGFLFCAKPIHPRSGASQPVYAFAEIPA